jgi:hypothetical protein
MLSQESHCSLNIDAVSLTCHQFVGGRPAHRYSFYTGDEVVAAPFALFQVAKVKKRVLSYEKY